jgi:hypothetical protein
VATRNGKCSRREKHLDTMVHGDSVELQGVSGEEIKLTSIDANMKVVVHKVVIPKSGSTIISLRKQGVVDVK